MRGMLLGATWFAVGHHSLHAPQSLIKGYPLRHVDTAITQPLCHWSLPRDSASATCSCPSPPSSPSSPSSSPPSSRSPSACAASCDEVSRMRAQTMERARTPTQLALSRTARRRIRRNYPTPSDSCASNLSAIAPFDACIPSMWAGKVRNCDARETAAEPARCRKTNAPKSCSITIITLCWTGGDTKH